VAASIHADDGDVGFQIAPMVDVVFVLMLFFMACSGLQQKEVYLRSRLPAPGPRPGPTPIVIEISADGVVSMNNQLFARSEDRSLPKLRAWLTETMATFGDKDPVVISPSPAAKHERLVDVLNAAASANVRNLSLR
jgi:biopolymer transport protein ExbD